MDDDDEVVWDNCLALLLALLAVVCDEERGAPVPAHKRTNLTEP